jgi:hypothetical protein
MNNSRLVSRKWLLQNLLFKKASYCQ